MSKPSQHVLRLPLEKRAEIAFKVAVAKAIDEHTRLGLPVYIWRNATIPLFPAGQIVATVTAKVVIYEAFVEGKLEAPKHLARTVHDLYFEPKYEEFRPRTIWSLSNAFTSAFKELYPIPQFRATAKLGEFLEARFSQSF
jgi:hypothetical protein